MFIDTIFCISATVSSPKRRGSMAERNDRGRVEERLSHAQEAVDDSEWRRPPTGKEWWSVDSELVRQWCTKADRDLTSNAVAVRYPDACDIPTVEEAREALALTRAARQSLDRKSVV